MTICNTGITLFVHSQVKEITLIHKYGGHVVSTVTTSCKIKSIQIILHCLINTYNIMSDKLPEQRFL